MAAEGEHRIVAVDGHGREVLIAELRHLDRPDLAAVEALARLQLAARRVGWTIRVRGACAHLTGLMELVGLRELLDVPPAAPVAGEPAADPDQSSR